MTTHVELRRGAYADSVTLLQVSRSVQGADGVAAAQVAMATAAQRRGAHRDGLRRARRGDAQRHGRRGPARPTAASLDAALAGVDAALADRTAPGRRPQRGGAAADDRRRALRRTPGAIALVSVPGPHAFVEAMDALEAGRDVMIFSDNVPVDQELALKRAAAERGLLVMGPDCGTAVVGGLGLGFANVVSPGPVGIVAASGTGCQQVLALLDHAGVGVSSALGVGGRDLSAEVGGLATREALRRLDADPAVELIVLVSKPPAPRGRGARSRTYADVARHPGRAGAARARASPDLTEATEAVLSRLGRGVPDWPVVGLGRGAAGGRSARALRRRHAVPARRRSSRPGSSVRTRATRSWTSATTPTPPAGPIR